MERDTNTNFWKRPSVTRRRMLAHGATVGVGASAWALAGCGDDDSGTPAKTQAPAGSPAASTSPAGTAAATRPAAKKPPAGDLVVAQGTLDNQVADPHQRAANQIIICCFEQFSRWDTNGQLVPALASKVEEPPDHSKLIFTLRPDATFWDGTPVTSADAKWSYDRYLAVTQNPDTYQVNTKAEVQSVETPDPRTVVVNLKAPSPQRLTRGLISPQGWNIASQAYYAKVGEDTFAKQPMASGPFKLISNDVQKSFKFQAYAGHYERVPAFNTARFDLVAETTTRLARLQTGEADLIDGVAGPTRGDVTGNSELKLYETPGTNCPILFYQDVTKPPYNDLRVRQALRLAIDQDAMIKSLLNGGGTRSIGAAFFPITKGFDAQKFPVQEYDPEKAKALLAQAGFASGLKVKLWSAPSGTAPAVPQELEAAAGMWKKIGVDTDLQVLEAQALIDRYRAKSLDGLAVLGTAANVFPSFLLSLYYLPATQLGVATEPGNPAKIAQLNMEFDEAKYTALTQEIFKSIVDGAHGVAMPYGNTGWGARKNRIASWTPNKGNAFTNAIETIIPA